MTVVMMAMSSDGHLKLDEKIVYLPFLALLLIAFVATLFYAYSMESKLAAALLIVWLLACNTTFYMVIFLKNTTYGFKFIPLYFAIGLTVIQMWSTACTHGVSSTNFNNPNTMLIQFIMLALNFSCSI